MTAAPLVKYRRGRKEILCTQILPVSKIIVLAWRASAEAKRKPAFETDTLFRLSILQEISRSCQTFSIHPIFQDSRNTVVPARGRAPITSYECD